MPLRRKRYRMDIGATVTPATNDSKADDEAALQDFYSFADGPNWDWNGSTPAGWASSGMDLDNSIDGIVTYQFGGETRVKEINLSGYPDGRTADGSLEAGAPIGRNLTAKGDFPSTFGNLKAMTHLRLKGNDLRCNLDWLPNLFGGELQWCSLNGSSGYGGQDEIQYNDLTHYNHPSKSRDSYNTFVGPLPDDMRGFSKLEHFECNCTVLIGPLPTYWPSTMKGIMVQNNSIKGDIGNTQYGNLSNVTHFYIGNRCLGNRGSGEVESVVDNGGGTYDVTFTSSSPIIVTPSRVDIGELMFVIDTEKIGQVLSKPDSSTLRIEYLYSDVPPSVGETWTVAGELEGQYNNYGVIPADWDNMSAMRWYFIGGNQFTGDHPNLPSWFDVRMFDLSVVPTMTIPWPNYLIDTVGENTALHTLVLGNCTGTIDDPATNGGIGTAEFNMANGNIQGTIPSWIPNATQVDLSNNDFEGPVPSGAFDTNNNLRFLYLNDNPRLDGSLPTIDESHANFREVLLHNCAFSGTIPTHYGQFNSTSGGTFDTLRLDNNELVGPIPSSFFGNSYSRNIANNFFVFSDLIGNDLSGITYAPQKNFGSQSDYDSGTGVIDFSSIVSHANNEYEWQINSSTVSGETTSSIDTGTHGAGTYQLIVTNTTLTDLTLNSVQITV